jgi:hypothetical protein
MQIAPYKNFFETNGFYLKIREKKVPHPASAGNLAKNNVKNHPENPFERLSEQVNKSSATICKLVNPRRVPFWLEISERKRSERQWVAKAKRFLTPKLAYVCENVPSFPSLLA